MPPGDSQAPVTITQTTHNHYTKDQHFWLSQSSPSLYTLYNIVTMATDEGGKRSSVKMVTIDLASIVCVWRGEVGWPGDILTPTPL